jgi:dihydroxy-acid dehydratase
MMSSVEALGMTLPGASSIPAADSGHPRMATASGRRIVEMVWEDLKPRDVMTTKAFENAVTVAMSLGGSTNSIVHLIAMAGRAGAELDLEKFDALSRRTPLLGNVRPSGKFLMEDFFYAGGLRALIRELGELINRDAVTVNGRTIGENVEGAETYNREVIAGRNAPVYPEGGLAVLRGNLCPSGAVVKHSAMEKRLRKHAGKAVAFEDYEEMAAKLDSPDLDVTADSVLVLKNAGPLGGPGMPEWGMLPIPKKLLKQGVRDMLRVSDARMSGTSYGACVLHVAPESAVGGPLALVRTGDTIAIDVDRRSLMLEVPDAELASRRAIWKPKPTIYERGYGAMFVKHVTQADKGCDFDFLAGTARVPEPEIH